jgi:aspartyl-tRNA(Asn)/glutamyl-tRNA(Gln) amidotransferase subunit B
MPYEAVIGLEVHAQLLTRSKIFCGCSTRFGEAPNTQTCPVCLGMPGSLPVLNRRAVEMALRTALALECEIAPRSRFARKNYFYPDLPKNYQISQYELPLARRGGLDIPADGGRRRIGIRRVHLEEDAGKLVHVGAFEAATASFVDFNRCGVPLIEIVSEADLRSPEEATEYLRQLRDILVYLEVCDGNMEEGSFRCDANVSIRPPGAGALGTKTEVKNMNSFRFLQRALEHEIRRQAGILDGGGTVVQETRLFDAEQGITCSMRSKEEAHDYRYFPEPDLVPVEVGEAWIAELRAGLPELPARKRRRFAAQYGLPEQAATVLTATRAMADFFEACVGLHPEPTLVSHWVMGDLAGYLKKDGRAIEASPVSPAALAGLLRLVADGTISGKIAKAAFEEMYATGREAAAIVRERGLVQITDPGELSRIVDEVIAANPGPVGDYRGGKEQSFTFLVGQTMKATRGKANPKLVNELLRAKLAGGPGSR